MYSRTRTHTRTQHSKLSECATCEGEPQSEERHWAGEESANCINTTHSCRWLGERFDRNQVREIRAQGDYGAQNSHKCFQIGLLFSWLIRQSFISFFFFCKNQTTYYISDSFFYIYVQDFSSLLITAVQVSFTIGLVLFTLQSCYYCIVFYKLLKAGTNGARNF